MADEFSPGGNPQDRFKTIDPASYLPADFVPATVNPLDAQATIDAVEVDILQAQQAGDLNKALDISLGVLRAVLGVAKV